MEYCRTAQSLLPGRVEMLEKDMLHILESCDFSSFHSFKLYWAANNCSMIHQCIHVKELKEEFYQALYGILTSFMHINTEMAIKSTYILYTIYFTQIHKPVLIPITPDTASILLNSCLIVEDCKNMIAKLAQAKAFQIGLCEGVKSIFRVKKSKTESSVLRNKKNINELEEKIEDGLECDLEKVRLDSLNYLVKKERIKEKLRENLYMFENAEMPKNPIAQYFRASNLEILDLTSPSFPLSIASRLKTIEKIIDKYEQHKSE